MYVVRIGSPVAGYRHFGPFVDETEARIFGQEQANIVWNTLCENRAYNRSTATPQILSYDRARHDFDLIALEPVELSTMPESLRHIVVQR